MIYRSTACKCALLDALTHVRSHFTWSAPRKWATEVVILPTVHLPACLSALGLSVAAGLGRCTSYGKEIHVSETKRQACREKKTYIHALERPLSQARPTLPRSLRPYRRVSRSGNTESGDDDDGREFQSWAAVPPTIPCSGACRQGFLLPMSICPRTSVHNPCRSVRRAGSGKFPPIARASS